LQFPGRSEISTAKPFKQAKYKEALDYFDRALKVANEIGYKDSLFRWFYLKGQTYRELKRNKDAIANLKKSIAILEEIRGAIKVEELKTSFIKQYINVYEMLIELLIKEGETGEAFNYAERGKARNFLDVLGNKKIVPREAGDRKLAEKERILLARIRSMEKASESLKGQELRKLRRKMREVRRGHDEALEKLKLSNPEYASLITVIPPKLEEIQESLAPSEIILEYFVGGKNTYIWIVTKEKIAYEVIPRGAKDISREVGLLRSEMAASRGKTIAKEDLRLLRKRLTDFYSLVIKPVEEHIKGGHSKPGASGRSPDKLLIIVPHGPLHYIPFSALIDDNGRYLVENYSILIEPSASSFALFRKRKNTRPRSFLGYALGNVAKKTTSQKAIGKAPKTRNKSSRSNIIPEIMRGRFSSLPGSRIELEEIKKILIKKNFKTQTYMENEFTRKKAEETALNGGMVHFSTHGVLSGRAKGRFSGLIAFDGYIYIIDVFNWNLNADMVVLSACQTGMGKLFEGDDMVGLSRAFLQAGSDNLVATLWNVQDKATQLFMVDFYREILSGKSKADALREAQLKLMKTYPHPFYWSTYIIFGKG